MNKQKIFSTGVLFALILAVALSSAAPAFASQSIDSNLKGDVPSFDLTGLWAGNSYAAATVDLPRIYAQLHDDGIRYEYAAPGALVIFSIYDAPQGNLLWTDSRRADRSGFAFVTHQDHRVELAPGMAISVSSGRTTKELVVEALTFDIYEPARNVLAGTAPSGSSVLLGVGSNSGLCETVVEADGAGNWIVDFNDYGCDVTPDLGAYAQVIDAEGDTTEVWWTP